MKILALSALLLTSSATALFGQSYIIKVSQLDSLIWMASKAKTCDTALNFALETLSAKEALIVGQGKLIELRAKEIGVLKELDQNWQARQDNLIKTQELQTAKLKAKLSKRNRIIAGQSVVIVALLAILL